MRSEARCPHCGHEFQLIDPDPPRTVDLPKTSVRSAEQARTVVRSLVPRDVLGVSRGTMESVIAEALDAAFREGQEFAVLMQKVDRVRRDVPEGG